MPDELNPNGIRRGMMVRYAARTPRGKDPRCYERGRVQGLYRSASASRRPRIKATICFAASTPVELWPGCPACYSYDVRHLEPVEEADHADE